MQSARNGMQRRLLGAYAAKIYGYAEEPAQRAAQPRSGASRTGSLQQTICAGGRVLIFQIACRVQSVGLCGLDQRIDHCADLRAKRRIAEQPVLSPNGKRTYRALCAVVGQLQPSAAGNVHQPALLPQGISRSTHAKGSPARFKAILRYAQPPPAASAAGGGLIFSDVIAHRSGLCSPPGFFPAAASFRCSPPQRPRPAKAASALPPGIAQARFHRPAPCPKGRSE